MISSTIYLDQLNKCYKKILTIKPEPSEPLKTYTKRIHLPKLSPFKQNNCCEPVESCVYAIKSPSNPSEFLRFENINELFSLLLTNSYTINTELTNLLKPTAASSSSGSKNSLPELICVVTKLK